MVWTSQVFDRLPKTDYTRLSNRIIRDTATCLIHRHIYKHIWTDTSRALMLRSVELCGQDLNWNSVLFSWNHSSTIRTLWQRALSYTPPFISIWEYRCIARFQIFGNDMFDMICPCPFWFILSLPQVPDISIRAFFLAEYLYHRPGYELLCDEEQQFAWRRCDLTRSSMYWRMNRDSSDQTTVYQWSMAQLWCSRD